MSLSPEILEKVERLQNKFGATGQDLLSYLDGLLYADYLTYWDYIHLDTLLSLQNPKTLFPDEEIFIMYHQITELYFKLILHESKQICEKENIDTPFFLNRLNRINRYFGNLTQSFLVMVEGMDREQFLKFRMSLLPASGFQSAQYRMIEIFSTDFLNLVAKDKRANFSDESNLKDMFEHIYWKTGATELATGNKTLTLKQFEQKYAKELIELANKRKGNNIWTVFQSLDKTDAEIIKAMKKLDTNVNVDWPLAHYKSAVKYLQRNPEDIKATGGTNWQQYLPPRFQKRIFYPSLWTAHEVEEWGKAWVDEALKY